MILPQYDTAFAFDLSNRIALVANKNQSYKNINPITGLEENAFDYFFIDQNNQRLKLKEGEATSPRDQFEFQQELHLNYLNNNDEFKVMYNSKVYLFSKEGKQLSFGYDNIEHTSLKDLFIVESIITQLNKTERVYGVISKNKGEVLKPKFHNIIINTDDSLIIACNAIFNYSLADEVYDLKGKLLYPNKNHIEYASKKIKVLKVFEPEVYFELIQDGSQKKIEVAGEEFKLSGNNKAVIVDKEKLILVDLNSFKMKTFSKEKLLDNFNKLMMND